MRVASTPRGGTISTEVTNVPAASFPPPSSSAARGDRLHVGRPMRDVAQHGRRRHGRDAAARLREARAQRTHEFAHRTDVLRRRAAASADDLRAGVHQVARVLGHVLGARHVHAAPAHVARHAGVGLSAQLPARERDHLLDRLENGLWTDRAVQPDDIGAEPVERADDVLG
jgi:hypothetical protein